MVFGWALFIAAYVPSEPAAQMSGKCVAFAAGQKVGASGPLPRICGQIGSESERQSRRLRKANLYREAGPSHVHLLQQAK
jgi:hypothetical protein